MDEFFNLNPKVATALSTLIGFLLIDDLTANEQLALGNWILLIGQILITNSSSQALIEARAQGPILNINSKAIKCKYDPLFYNIDVLKEVIKACSPNQMENIFNEIKSRIDKIESTINNFYQ